ncbi:class I SAM-dependent methyltransferase [Nitriliruptoria bacterium AS10]|nr:class I SAM-dependent methyltransferase [Salsipaludibacter albus]MBY5162741.1 class I SAM-dependent methyltransferase [Salsipaludibacter albus]
MGRYSGLLAAPFADFAEVEDGQVAVDVGCGPGALTGELVGRLGAGNVSACDPSPSFVAACRQRHPGVDVHEAAAEELPFADASTDRVLAQLVLHFVDRPDRVAEEFRRVLRPGGVAAASVWHFAEGMEMLRLFWDAALAIDPQAPDEARTLRFGRPGQIAGLLVDHGFSDVHEDAITVSSTYADIDELWHGFLAGVGPAGGYLVGRPEDQQEQVRAELVERLGAPSGAFTLDATALCARGRAGG